MRITRPRGLVWGGVGLGLCLGLAVMASPPVALVSGTSALAGPVATEQVDAGQPAQDKQPGAALRKFMREKLAANQKALEGLCVEDYRLIAEAADKLASMSRAAEWQVIPGPEYSQLSGEFRLAVEQLKKGARDKNLEASRLAYLKATMSCLDCHDFVRSTRLAALPDKALPDGRPLESLVQPAG